MLEAVLKNYGLVGSGVRCEALGNHGGFSGAQLWRLETPQGPLCVRQWPLAHPTEEQLVWIHGVVQHAFAAGCECLPRPLVDQRGHTHGNYGGYFWEVTPWMPGVADFALQPSAERLVAAMETLAQFHHATSVLKPRHGIPPAVVIRHAFCRWLIEGGGQRLEAALGHLAEDLRDLSRRIVDQALPLVPRIGQTLACCRVPFPLQPCLRDLRQDHVLFSGTQVTGIVDFGAMRYDHVSADLSRLLTSLVPGDEGQFAAGLRAYERRRPLAAGERDTVHALALASVPLSALQWVRWLALERKEFSNPQAVMLRMGGLAQQLDRGSA